MQIRKSSRRHDEANANVKYGSFETSEVLYFKVISTTCQLYTIIIGFFQRIFHHFILSVFEIPTTSTNFTKNSNKNIQIMVTSSTTSTKKTPIFLENLRSFRCFLLVRHVSCSTDAGPPGDWRSSSRNSQEPTKTQEIGCVGEDFSCFSCLFFLNKWRMNVNKYFGKGELLLKHFLVGDSLRDEIVMKGWN